MKTSRRKFLQTSALGSLAATHAAIAAPSADAGRSFSLTEPLDSFGLAARHVIRRQIPGPTFFEGMLLGNGDIGACAVVRPDALGIHISKSDCWDIRVTEGSEKSLVPFAEIVKMWERASEEAKKRGDRNATGLESYTDELRAYCSTVSTAYDPRWPRPWPCGTVWLNWDSRWVEPIDYSLNPANGLFQVALKCSSLSGTSRTVELRAFVDWESGLVSVESSDTVPILSVSYTPQIDGFHEGPFDPGHADKRPEQLPWPELAHRTEAAFAEFSCFQYFPAIGPTKEQPVSPRSDKDRNFSLYGRVAGRWAAQSSGDNKDIVLLPASEQRLRLSVIAATPRDVLLRRLEIENAAKPVSSALDINFPNACLQQGRA